MTIHIQMDRDNITCRFTGTTSIFVVAPRALAAGRKLPLTDGVEFDTLRRAKAMGIALGNAMPVHKSLISTISSALPSLACGSLLSKVREFERALALLRHQNSLNSRVWLHIGGEDDDGRWLVLLFFKNWISQLNRSLCQFVELDTSIKTSGIYLSCDSFWKSKHCQIAVMNNFSGSFECLPPGIVKVLRRCRIVISVGQAIAANKEPFSVKQLGYHFGSLEVPQLRELIRNERSSLEYGMRLAGIVGLSEEAKSFLISNYAWPGNIREWELFARVYNALMPHFPGNDRSAAEVAGILEMSDSVKAAVLLSQSKCIRDLEEIVEVFGVRFAESGFSIWNLSKAIALAPNLKRAAERLKIPQTTLVHRRKPLEAARKFLPPGLL